ncbi:MAG: type II toxin-antitoxin system ParD family antitoxin [Propionibacteriaceae bacterium]|jgi:antitoxin ParD1/3/4|nr:type II toxin-antitoxin system ParD family antitoxin [Propionibacteriaceae bacterium]
MISAELGSQLEEYVTTLVAQGRYGSKSEVIREGVRLVQDHETRRMTLSALLDDALSRSDQGQPLGSVMSRLEEKYQRQAGQ